VLRHILVVEDNRADVFLIREAITAAGIEAEIHIVGDGEKAIGFLRGAERGVSPQPDLVILDINLPRRPGREVVEYLRGNQCSARTRVLIVTSSDSERDREEMARLGVDEYFCKPSEYEGFLQLGRLARTLLGE
jgi:CheY-like chemotaxis protein